MKTPIESQENATPSVRVEYHVRFTRGPRGRRRARNVGDPRAGAARDRLWAGYGAPDRDVAHELAGVGPLTKTTRLLVLGHHFERLVRVGVVKDYAEIARLTGLTRARVTQIVNLTLLAPGIQEAILFASCGLVATAQVPERRLRKILTLNDWAAQRGALPSE